MTSLLLIGCGGHSRSVIEIVESSSQWSIGGLIGLSHQVGSTVLGYPVLGSDDDLQELRADFDYALLAIGQMPSADVRKKLNNILNFHNFYYPVVVAASAVVSKYSSLDVGTVIGHQATVNAGAVVGKHCIINTASIVEHDSIISDFCHVSTNVAVNGDVTLGHSSFLGSCSMIREGLVLPPYTIVSAGCRVMGWPLKKK